MVSGVLTEYPVFEGIVGSHAYGLAHADSDLDVMAVHVQPTRLLVGLDAPPDETIREKRAEGDWISYEIGKFIRLVGQGNPTVTELLWLDVHTIYDGLGEELIEMRRDFLSQNCKDRYLGYATQQFKKLQRDGRFGNVPDNRIEKNARHMLRLIEQGSHLWLTGELRLEVENPDRLRETAHRIATEENGADLANRFLAAGEEAFAQPTPLPPKPYLGHASEFLLDLRQEIFY